MKLVSQRARASLAGMVLLVVLTGCKAVITLDPSVITIAANETLQIQATSTSDKDTSFTWTSADPKVATVDQTGTITGVDLGQTTITAKGSASQSEGTASVTVHRPEGALSPLSVSVDTSIMPVLPPLPPLSEGAPTRPLAAIVDERGDQAEFVENELILVTDDTDAVNAFVARWEGEELAVADPSSSDLDMPQMHLIRINTALGDASKLQDDILTIDPDARGIHHVSSDAGLRLISASAQETVGGATVGLNWVGQGSSINYHSTTEASTGPGGFNSAGSGYSPDAFDWNYLDEGSTQDIGVTEAWYLLSRAHKLSNKVKLAILDMGFSVDGNNDIPAGWTAISNVAFTSAVGTSNLLSCTGGNPCPWHGTEVLGAAMGVPDNSFGGAGPAGPVARPIMVFTLYDFFTSISAIIEARALGARVVNMSYGTGVPTILAFSILPFEIATAAAAHWMVICASAGNEGKNVDDEDCFIVCWESKWWTPCENDGVICVGGLAQNSKLRATNSNYGGEDVDIFGPYSVIVGPDPASGPGAQQKNGTSFSSPFVAGVAALVWAANPSLSASDVRNILKTTAHSSPDNRVKRYVDAYAAVSKALGPVIVIESPENGASLHGNFPVTFESFAYDAGVGAPAVRWTSSINGLLGTDPTITANNLSYGTHTIRAHATFPDSTVSEDTITIHIVNDPPTVTLTSPTNGASFYQGQPVLLAATSSDINEPGYVLSDAQISWYVDGALVGHNHTRTIAAGTLSLGAHTIRVVGTDGTNTVERSVTITTNPNPVDLPPDQVNITSPAQGADLSSLIQYDPVARKWYINVAMQGNAHDPEDGALTGASLAWSISLNGQPALSAGTGTSATSKVFVAEGVTTFDITLRATDSAANSTSATIRATATIILK